MVRTIVLVIVVSLLSAVGFATQALATAPRPAQPPKASYGSPEVARLFRHANINHAFHNAQQTGRPMLVYVVSNQCVHCKRMLADTFSHPQIGRGIATYSEPVVVNASEHRQLSKQLGVRAFPTTLVISPQNELLAKIEGFAAPQDFAEQVWPIFQPTRAAALSASKAKAGPAAKRAAATPVSHVRRPSRNLTAK